MSYRVLVLEVPTEPTPGTSSTIQIQLGCDAANLDQVTRWLDRLERSRLIVRGGARNWVAPESPDDAPTEAQISD